ncbi:CsbD family protein [Tessaracoccus sp. OS52]|uniref:CsbD family protein n=1 Tax=Tessaracoccus sp. OS52 TaxID=2886691 RepID=UPI001D12E103|nr:CsbD family protein [Tessaracoccus sp. OS52]MCC2592965.1 CsbD family protein [Tessaracoccus sp. OS52]
MGLGDKISNAAEETKGKIKESVGDATDNEQLEAEGRLEQGKANVKQGVEDVKDSASEAFNDATDRDHRH